MRVPKRKIPNIILTILLVCFLVFALFYMRHLAVTNSERIDRQDSIISNLVVQRNTAQNGAAAAVGAVEEANDKLEASGQTPVEIPREAIVGASGPRGLPGATGAAGADSTVPGPPGPRGPVGRDGEDGEPGAAGSDGIDGVDGETGPPGSDGESGAQGVPGASVTGPPGPAGPAGPQGEPGPAGNDGRDGSDGMTGENGQPPAGWVSTREDGSTEICEPIAEFDPASPRYQCMVDGGAVPVPPVDEGEETP